jgi:ABC-2 type transport system permease protein
VQNTAGGIATFAAIFFVIPPLVDVLPSSWYDAISPYLPDSAGRSIFMLTGGSHSLAPAPGIALLAGYCVLALAIAAVLLVRCDTKPN